MFCLSHIPWYLLLVFQQLCIVDLYEAVHAADLGRPETRSPVLVAFADQLQQLLHVLTVAHGQVAGNEGDAGEAEVHHQTHLVALQGGPSILAGGL